jgi:hypothetical protein
MVCSSSEVLIIGSGSKVMWKGTAVCIVQRNQFPSINSPQNLDLAQICNVYCMDTGAGFVEPKLPPHYLPYLTYINRFY